MDDFEPTLEDRARAMRAAEGILMPGRHNDQNRFWFTEGWLNREPEIARLHHRGDIDRRLIKCLIAQAEHERQRVNKLIEQLQLSGDGFVKYALDRYSADTLDE